MTVDLGKLLSENYTVKAHLEATCGLTGQRDIARILTACQYDVELLEILRVVKRTDRDRATVLSKVEFSDSLESLRMQ